MALLHFISDGLFGFEPLCAWAEMLAELQLHANMHPVVLVWLWFQFSPVGCVRSCKVISARTFANAKVALVKLHLCCCWWSGGNFGVSLQASSGSLSHLIAFHHNFVSLKTLL